MVLGTTFDSNVPSYPVLVIMKDQGAVVERGGACPRTSGEAKPTLGRRARRSQPSGVGRDGANPQRSGETELTLGRWARGVVVFLSVRKHQRLMVISSSSVGTLVFDPQHFIIQDCGNNY